MGVYLAEWVVTVDYLWRRIHHLHVHGWARSSQHIYMLHQTSSCSTVNCQHPEFLSSTQKQLLVLGSSQLVSLLVHVHIHMFPSKCSSAHPPAMKVRFRLIYSGLIMNVTWNNPLPRSGLYIYLYMPILRVWRYSSLFLIPWSHFNAKRFKINRVFLAFFVLCQRSSVNLQKVMGTGCLYFHFDFLHVASIRHI